MSYSCASNSSNSRSPTPPRFPIGTIRLRFPLALAFVLLAIPEESYRRGVRVGLDVRDIDVRLRWEGGYFFFRPVRRHGSFFGRTSRLHGSFFGRTSRLLGFFFGRSSWLHGFFFGRSSRLHGSSIGRRGRASSSMVKWSFGRYPWLWCCRALLWRWDASWILKCTGNWSVDD